LSVNISGGNDAHPFRAQQSIPCLIGECPGKMRLVILRADGTLLQRPFNDGPHYRCNRVGCHYHDNPRGLHELNTNWVNDAARKQDKIEAIEDIERKKDVLT
jgi:hypothetical protein